MKLEESPHGRGEGRLSSTVPWERKGKTLLIDLITPYFKNNSIVFSLYLNMTKTQIQTEIQKVLDSVPETILQDVLDFLKALQDQPAEKVRLTNNLRQILSEDKELLEKLAQ
jgi:hypothetical protein